MTSAERTHKGDLEELEEGCIEEGCGDKDVQEEGLGGDVEEGCSQDRSVLEDPDQARLLEDEESIIPVRSGHEDRMGQAGGHPNAGDLGSGRLGRGGQG